MKNKLSYKRMEEIQHQYMETLKNFHNKITPQLIAFLKEQINNLPNDMNKIQKANWAAHIAEDCFINQCDKIDHLLGVPTGSFFRRLQSVDLKTKNLWDGKNMPN